MKKVSCFVSANIHKSLIRPAIAVSLLVLTVIAAVPAEDHPVTRTLRPLSYNIHHAEGRTVSWTLPGSREPSRPQQIDFVLYRTAGQFRVVEVKVVEEKVASDHRPVLAVLEWVGK